MDIIDKLVNENFVHFHENGTILNITFEIYIQLFFVRMIYSFIQNKTTDVFLDLTSPGGDLIRMSKQSSVKLSKSYFGLIDEKMNHFDKEQPVASLQGIGFTYPGQ